MAKNWTFIDPSESISSDKQPNTGAKQNLRKEQRELAVFESRVPHYKFENLVLPEEALAQLKTLETRLAKHDLIYETWGLAETDPCGKHIAFNLFGPPGTGKTMCVEALASKWGKKIIDVSYAEIESKYPGDTGKNIEAAFKAAKEQDAVLFFDEADCILGHRMTNVTGSADQAVNNARSTMLKSLDAFDGIVAFATNLARNFDSAFVRRIQNHVEIPLPNREGRYKIARRLVPNKVPFKAFIDFDSIAEITEGLSGGDIKNVIVNAITDIASGDWVHITHEDVNKAFKRNVGLVLNSKKNVGTKVKIVSDEEIKY